MFSVVVPTFGRRELLAESLASVLAQSCPDFECIVVDDAGPESPAIPADERVRVVRRERNGGPAAARNTGIAAAVGRYLAFLDDDDVWVADRLEAAALAHERAPVVVCWQSTLGTDSASARGRSLEGQVGDTILDTITPHLGATTIERTRAPAFDERYDSVEDVEWWLRVAQALTVTTVAATGLLYRAHAGPRTRTGPEDRVRGSQMLLAEHAEWFAAHPRAKAFRLQRLGHAAFAAGDRALARRSFAAALRLRPKPRTLWHLAFTLSPVGSARG
jgi:glycosyltransferase involved in cell wall biosynthesis